MTSLTVLYTTLIFYGFIKLQGTWRIEYQHVELYLNLKKIAKFKHGTGHIILMGSLGVFLAH